MKYLPFALIACVIMVVSCHKSHTPAPAPTPTPTATSPISGLTGIRFSVSVDSSGIPVGQRYITWNFTGTNPIVSIPAADSDYLGHEQMSFTGSNAMQIVYTIGSSHLAATLVQSMSVSYTAANYIDTITLVYLPMPLPGYKKIVFEYSGPHITKVTVGNSANIPDTVVWHEADYYYYTYTGDNISQVVTSRYNGTYYSNDTTTLVSGSRHNNFAGSIPTYLLLEFIINAHIGADFAADLPMYVNANLIDSVRYNTNSVYVISYAIDTMGRVTKSFGANNASDTTYYYY